MKPLLWTQLELRQRPPLYPVLRLRVGQEIRSRRPKGRGLGLRLNQQLGPQQLPQWHHPPGRQRLRWLQKPPQWQGLPNCQRLLAQQRLRGRQRCFPGHQHLPRRQLLQRLRRLLYPQRRLPRQCLLGLQCLLGQQCLLGLQKLLGLQDPPEQQLLPRKRPLGLIPALYLRPGQRLELYPKAEPREPGLELGARARARKTRWK